MNLLQEKARRLQQISVTARHSLTPFFLLPQNHEKETALHCAAQYGHSDVVSVLLHELTDPTMRNSQQETPLDLAALYGRLEVSPTVDPQSFPASPKGSDWDCWGGRGSLFGF